MMCENRVGSIWGNQMDGRAETATITAGQPAPLFTVGGVLSRSFSLMFRRFGLFFGLCLISVILSTVMISLLAPTLVRWLPQSSLGLPGPLASISVASLIQTCANGAVSAIFYGACGFAAFQIASGERVTLLTVFNALYRNFFCVFGVAILYATLVALSSLLFYLPIFLITCFLLVSPAACVTERLGVMASLERSVELTRGYRWRIVALMFLLGIVVAGMQLGYPFVHQAVARYGLTPSATSLTTYPVIQIGISVLFRSLILMLIHVTHSVIYSSLRTTKMAGVGGLERVFE